MEHKLRSRLMKKAGQFVKEHLLLFIKAFITTLASLSAGYTFYSVLKLLAGQCDKAGT